MRTIALTVALAAAEKLNVPEGSPLAALQSQLAMVEQSVKAAGKVTPQVYETVKKMKGMVETIIEPAINGAHAADQKLVYVTHKEILQCDAAYRAFVDEDIKKGWEILNNTETEWVSCSGSVEELKAKFSNCLDERDLLVQHNNTICCQEYAMCSGEGDCERVKLEQAHVGCDYRSKTADECFAHAQNLIASLEGYFNEQDKRYEEMRVQCAKFQSATKGKIAECAYLQEAVNSKAGEANKIADDVNNGGAALVKDCKQRCIDYKKCREEKETQYHTVCGPCAGGDYAAGNGCVMARETDRKNEWTSTQLIKCMLEHYCQGGHFDEELLEKCKEEIHACHLIIDYPAVPAEIPCEIPNCPHCPGCGECVDRPYYQYQLPCYATPVPEGCTSVEKPECPGWCQ